MCLTGVDYFSTLGYQPGIAFLAAGFLSPVATLILVIVTLFGALPVYLQVARQSPEGQGSIAMLERLFRAWKGKVMVLCLLGFAATDFVITMTLSAADAAAHVIQNPFAPGWIHHQLAVTLMLLAILGAIFLMGFREAIGVAVILVAIYLGLNAVVVGVGFSEVWQHPGMFANWRENLWKKHGSPLGVIGFALLVFPRLALGLSGFETGVAVMPLVDGGSAVSNDELAGRIANTRKLLVTAAVIMSVFLMASSVVTTFLIPPKEFQPGGPANGRALAFLAHRFLGEGFGSAYDISTILILGFAGASAMAGLLNLVPRYLPQYGMAPEWAKSTRPLVLVFSAISCAVTVLFHANVDAQGGAYATGVLVLMTSAAIAVTISMWKEWARWPFLLISAVFIYTTIVNVFERPEGIKIASVFIALTILTSLISRALRSTDLRITKVILDPAAQQIIAGDPDGIIRLIAHKPRGQSREEYDRSEALARAAHNLPKKEQLIFLEVQRGDPSDFGGPLHVRGTTAGTHNVLRAVSASIPNAIAALLLHIAKTTGKLPHAYFGWTEGNPIGYLFRFLFLGEGDVAPVTHEVLRKNIPDPEKRPFIHVT